MSQSFDNTEARERVLDAAEHLFALRGYTAVTLRDIAADVGIKHTSLYHHAPGGKEALFVEVIERHFQRHRSGLTEAVAVAKPAIEPQLQAAANWLLSQPPMDLMRFVYSDLPAIEPAHASGLSHAMYEATLVPIEALLQQARQRGEIEHHNLGLVAGGIFGMIESIHSVPEYALDQSRQAMAHELIAVMLDGLRREDN